MILCKYIIPKLGRKSKSIYKKKKVMVKVLYVNKKQILNGLNVELLMFKDMPYNIN